MRARLAGAVTILLSVALLARFIPARRAPAIDALKAPDLAVAPFGQRSAERESGVREVKTTLRYQ